MYKQKLKTCQVFTMGLVVHVDCWVATCHLDVLIDDQSTVVMSTTALAVGGILLKHTECCRVYMFETPGKL